MKILMAASECVPFVKVGGLADIAGVLPKFLKSSGHEVCIIIPKYKFLFLFIINHHQIFF